MFKITLNSLGSISHQVLINDESNENYNFYFFLVSTFFQISYASIKSNIIAKVGNEIITSFELENKIKTTLLLSNRELSQSNIDQVKN